MELKDYISEGIGQAGNLLALAERVGINRTLMSDAKFHRKGLPNYACIRLARIIGADPLQIIAASELVTEKKEERRAEWLPLLGGDWRARDDSNVRPLPSEGSTLSS